MAAVTQENGYQSTNNDMGTKHEKAHSRQHKYKQKDEPNIETLTDNKPSDLSTNLAVKMAQKQGLKNEETWEEYNRKQPTVRKKDSYEEYVAGVAGNFVKGKRRSLDKGIRHRVKDKKTGKMVTKYTPLGKQKREQTAQELAAIDRNGGIPIDGSLFYISNTMMYDQMTPAELVKFRKFERKTFEDFYHSDIFQEMNPGNIRSEIHFDENGSIHLQIQDVWYRVDTRNRGMYGKTASIKDALIKKYGSEDALNRRLDALCYCHDRYEKAPGAEDRIGSPTVASKYWDYVNSSNGDMEISEEARTDKRTGKVWQYKHSQPERRGRIEELWRLEQIKALADIATENAKEMGIDWQWDQTYTTDGIHKTGAGYIQHKEAMKGVNREKAAAEKHVKQLNKTSQVTNDTLKMTYKATVGHEAKNKDGKDLSPLEMYKGIQGAVKAAKQDADKAKSDEEAIKNELERLKKESSAQSDKLDEVTRQYQQLQQRIRLRQQERRKALADEIKQNKLSWNGKVPDVVDEKAVSTEQLEHYENGVTGWKSKQRKKWSTDKTNHQKLVSENKKLSGQNADLSSQNDDLSTKIDKKSDEYDTLVAINASLNDENEQLRKACRDNQKTIDDLQTQRDNLTDEVSSLTEQVKKLTETVKQNAEKFKYVAGQFVKNHWEQLKSTFDWYAQISRKAQEQRNQGHSGTAREMDSRAKMGIINTFDGIERQATDQYENNKQTDLDDTRR